MTSNVLVVDDWLGAVERAAKLGPKVAPAVVPAPASQPVVVKESAKPSGWRFVPHRDANNLITEIIAEPIE